MDKTSEINLTVEGVQPLDLFGENNLKLNLLRKAFPDVQITSRGNLLKLVGEKKETQEVKARFESMVRYLKEHHELSLHTMEDLLSGSKLYDSQVNPNSDGSIILHGREGRPIRAKTHNQKLMVEATEKNDIVFAIGPAGTGKTYTAVALAVRALKNRLVKKIVLTRPAVKALDFYQVTSKKK